MTEDTQKIIHHSIVQWASDDQNLQIENHGQDFSTQVIKSKFEKIIGDGEQSPIIPLLDPDDVATNGAIKDDTIDSHPTKDVHKGNIPSLHVEQSLNKQLIKLDPEHAIGRYILVPKCKDGQQFCTKILEWVDKYKDDLQMKHTENIKYKVLIGHNDGEQWEEIVAYNNLVQMIQDEDDGEDRIWCFKEIQAHQGSLSPSNQAYKGSRWNVLVAWETIEITMETLENIQHEKVMCALYARKT